MIFYSKKSASTTGPLVPDASKSRHFFKIWKSRYWKSPLWAIFWSVPSGPVQKFDFFELLVNILVVSNAFNHWKSIESRLKNILWFILWLLWLIIYNYINEIYWHHLKAEFELLLNRPFMFALVCYGDILQIGRFSTPNQLDNLDISDRWRNYWKNFKHRNFNF